MRIFILGLFILFSCTQCTSPPHVIAAHNVMDKFNKKMKKEKLSRCVAGGAMMKDVKQISVGYESYSSPTIDEARMLFIKNSELLLEEINTDVAIQPYLRDHPATTKNIRFFIGFLKEDGEFVDEPYIAYVGLMAQGRKIDYSVYSKEKGRLDTVLEEDYEEALLIYQRTLFQERNDIIQQ